MRTYPRGRRSEYTRYTTAIVTYQANLQIYLSCEYSNRLGCIVGESLRIGIITSMYPRVGDVTGGGYLSFNVMLLTIDQWRKREKNTPGSSLLYVVQKTVVVLLRAAIVNRTKYCW